MQLHKGKGVASANTSDDTLPWIEKYRPSTLEEVTGHQDIISTIERFIDGGKVPHMLLYGPPGTGKTSTILACARKIYGPKYKNQILELNASDDRGIDVVREQIKTFSSTRQISMGPASAAGPGFKLVVLDEADAMTQVAQNALRRTIEKYTRNVRFCIICNYVNKIITPIQSRCTRFRFSPLPIESVRHRVDHVIEAEGVKITDDGREALLKLSKGDMRRALNVLQACHAAYPNTSEEEVYACVGNPHPADLSLILNSMMSEEFYTSLRTITEIKTLKGLALQDILGGVYEQLEGVGLPVQVRVTVLERLAEIEYRLSTGSTEKIQLSAMIGGVKAGLDLAVNEV
ncbi:DNA replication factor [Saitoella complicata NRRL Y-17804]|nr:DNA replication factor [Saitoella complicata NRRL Y-17804]ODQ54700.1 DNA replication factor [Saitoella complicata NRRL Y-17804]